ncbi:MAG TPA: ATP-binding protein [Steroidobacteraceae bacterium]|nr:ATP-binding protein [Steroidobacteraceae bacterium]
MNTRSLSFRLVAWYAGLLLLVFGLLGGLIFAAVGNYLEANLRDIQLRRAQQIADTLLSGARAGGDAELAAAVESLYAPEANDRFIRISSTDGRLLFASASPHDESFDPRSVPALRGPQAPQSVRHVPQAHSADLLIASVLRRNASGAGFLVEVGASTAPIRSLLRRLLAVLLVGLPLAVLATAAGGFFLVRRALEPVERIAQKAEAITQHNLSERLPVAHSGDQIERLSVSLNLMINRLEEAVHSSKRFVADASHELRTPLTVLRGELESLMRNALGRPTLRETLGSMLEEVDRLTAVVEGLLALSRLDTGEARTEWVSFDLAELVSTTAEQMSLLAEDKHIALVRDCAAPVMVEGSRARLKQVVVNLLDNAIKYTGDGGTVRLRVAIEGDKGAFEVHDTGIGIPAEALPHIFERFYRVERSRSRDQGGAGLGLSIVKSICTAHAASIDVQSTPDRGSRFRVLLPLASALAPAEPLPLPRATAT